MADRQPTPRRRTPRKPKAPASAPASTETSTPKAADGEGTTKAPAKTRAATASRPRTAAKSRAATATGAATANAKPRTRKAPARKPAAKQATKPASTTTGRVLPTLAAVLGVAGAALAGIGLFRRRRASTDGSFGTGEHAAQDLAGDARPGATDRAPEAFRPDPTAPVPAGERDALRPALSRPTLVQPDRPAEPRADIEGGSTFSPQGGRVTVATNEAENDAEAPARAATGIGNL